MTIGLGWAFLVTPSAGPLLVTPGLTPGIHVCSGLVRSRERTDRERPFGRRADQRQLAIDGRISCIQHVIELGETHHGPPFCHRRDRALRAADAPFAQPLPKVVVGDNPSLSGAPLYIAIEKGYYREAGVDVQLEMSGTSAT